MRRGEGESINTFRGNRPSEVTSQELDLISVFCIKPGSGSTVLGQVTWLGA